MPLRHLPEVVDELAPLAAAFGSAGKRLFLVGGVVRDLWLDAELTSTDDIDLTTDAVPATTREIVAPLADAIWAQGERFGTIGCLIGGRDIEITTHRSEAYERSSRKPEVEFGDQIDGDLSRRDFTVNAMAVELPEGELVDPFGGAVDLAEGRLRTPAGAELSFGDDPLRMLRAARFVARYRLVPSDEVVSAMTTLADRLDIVATERIGDELDKLLGVTRPDEGLLLLHATGLLERIFPAMAARLDDGDMAVVGAVAQLPPDDRLSRWAMLAWLDGDGAESSARGFGERLRLSNARTNAIVGIVGHLGSIRQVAGGGLPALRRWAHGAGDQRERVLRLGSVVDHDATHRVREQLEALASREDLDDPGVPVDGAEVMKALGVGPGPKVGEALRRLREMRFEQGPLTRDQALAALESFEL